MKKLILTLVAALGMVAGCARLLAAAIPWDKAPVKTNDRPPCKMVPSCLSTTA